MPSPPGQQNFFSGEKKRVTKPFKSINVPRRLLVHGQHFQGLYWYIKEREAIKVGTTAETDIQIQVCTYASTELDPILLWIIFPPTCKMPLLGTFSF